MLIAHHCRYSEFVLLHRFALVFRLFTPPAPLALVGCSLFYRLRHLFLLPLAGLFLFTCLLPFASHLCMAFSPPEGFRPQLTPWVAYTACARLPSALPPPGRQSTPFPTDFLQFVTTFAQAVGLSFEIWPSPPPDQSLDLFVHELSQYGRRVYIMMALPGAVNVTQGVAWHSYLPHPIPSPAAAGHSPFFGGDSIRRVFDLPQGHWSGAVPCPSGPPFAWGAPRQCTRGRPY